MKGLVLESPNGSLILAKKKNLIIKKKKYKSYKRKFNRNGIDLFLEVRTSTFKRSLLCGIGAPGPQELVHKEQHNTQEAKNEEDEEKFGHASI